jgi:hypothetical protein
VTTTTAPPLPRTVPAAAAVAFLATTADNVVLFLLLWVAQPQGWSGVQTALVVLAVAAPGTVLAASTAACALAGLLALANRDLRRAG